jgi:hypothetical protein
VFGRCSRNSVGIGYWVIPESRSEFGSQGGSSSLTRGIRSSRRFPVSRTLNTWNCAGEVARRADSLSLYEGTSLRPSGCPKLHI